MISELWWQAWTYQVSLFPVLLTYLLFDSQALVRRLTRYHYVPIYFFVFPTGHTDKMYAEYFNEDDFYGVGEAMSPDQRQKLRKKIRVSAVVSMLSATVLAPYVCGILSAFYMSPQQFREFVCFLLIVKGSLLVHSLSRLRIESRAVSRASAFYCVVAIYAAYMFFVWRGLVKSFSWAHFQLTTTGFWGLIAAIGDLFHQEFFINIFAVAMFTYLVQQKFTSPDNIFSREWLDDESAID
jgi:hypothetical protein